MRTYLRTIVALASLCLSAYAQNGATVHNPERIALLRWYNANRATTLSVGNNPIAEVFDGASIWAANFGGNTVSKF